MGQSMPEYARVCQILPEYARLCQSMPEYARVCQSMPDYARLCQIMPEYARVLPEYAQVIPKLSPGRDQDVPKSSSVMPSRTHKVSMKPADRVQLLPLYSCSGSESESPVLRTGVI